MAVGDWTGRRRFDSGDLVAPFKEGGYQQGPIKEHISYRRRPQTFRVSYHIGTTSTSHWYDHGEQWQYYPD